MRPFYLPVKEFKILQKQTQKGRNWYLSIEQNVKVLLFVGLNKNVFT